jgi:hypothetical protein
MTKKSNLNKKNIRPPKVHLPPGPIVPGILNKLLLSAIRVFRNIFDKEDK